ncbi:hypothetical protein KIN20_019378 [Parelaphostrongylus tenuis]|uniref:Uncharacterized protein n=1 Tax=Parelaphostrongylus tenuis TaxID=148309 RepID=A0AAD5QV19_PARTN|nr:hypothetical protein KIN20_019378 [Parelaphostrongylus tenuis]
MISQRGLHRNILLDNYELESGAQTAFENINRAKSQRFVLRQTALRFIGEFRTGNTNMKNQLCSACPREVQREDVIEAIDEDPERWQKCVQADGACSE